MRRPKHFYFSQKAVKFVFHVKFCVPVEIRRSRINFSVLHCNIAIYTYAQVRLVMLPSKRQKHKTKVRQGNNPQYMESFLLHRVNPGKTSRQRNGWTYTAAHCISINYVKGTNMKQMQEVTVLCFVYFDWIQRNI